MKPTKDNGPAAIMVLAVLLTLAGALIITFTDWQWRGLVGAGLSLTGAILLLSGVVMAARRQEHVRAMKRHALRTGGDSVSSSER